MTTYKIDCDPALLLKKISEEILPKLKNGSAREKKEADKSLLDYSSKLFWAWGLETHYSLAEANLKPHRPLAMEVAKQIVLENDCKTASEKILAEIVVNAYIEVLTWTGKMNNCYAAGEYISDVRTRLIAVLSKELDRANRHFITALATLKQIKSPTIEFNVKAKTAFVSQNQQINAIPKDGLNQNENIEPK